MDVAIGPHQAITELLQDSTYSFELLLKRAQESNLNIRQLRDLLVGHQQDLQKTSSEIFNNSYDRFFRLSQLINCLSEPIHNVVDPIENYKDRLSQLCQNHDKYLLEIDNKLAALEETSRNKLYASKFIALISRRNRIFAQLGQLGWLKRESQAKIIEDVKQIIESRVKYDTVDRLAHELRHLSMEVEAIQPTSDELISIKKNLKSSIDKQQSLLNWSIQTFKSLDEHC